jgi:hypothetical protein
MYYNPIISFYRRRIEEEAREHADPTPRQADSLNKQRISLRDRIERHQKQRPRFMGILVSQEPDHLDISPPINNEPEHSQLGLPSSFSAHSILSSGLSSLADLEIDLRRGMCDDALDSIRCFLGAKAVAIKFKDQHIRGEIATTRAEVSLRAHSAKIAKARWRYDNSRAALIRLGAEATVLARYQEITVTDLKPLKSYLQDDSRGVGQGYVSIPWIWRNYDALNVDEWQVNGA